MRRSDIIDFKKLPDKGFGKMIISIIALVFGLILVANSWYTVNEQSSAVVLTAGRYTGTRGAGLHFRIPFIQSVEQVDITTRGMAIGYRATPDMGYQDVQDESLMITNDFNLVSVDFFVEWFVYNPRKSLFNVDEPERLLSNIVQSSARDIVSEFDVETVLTDGRTDIQNRIHDLTNQILENYDIGIAVRRVIIRDAEPPTQPVRAAFQAVEEARQRSETMYNEARRHENEVIPLARAEADGILRSAEATRESRINEAQGEIARFNEMYSEYRNNRAITKTRMYYETVEEILPDINVFIDGSDGNILRMLDITN
jgi:membrane protease subunit HflK